MKIGSRTLRRGDTVVEITHGEGTTTTGRFIIPMKYTDDSEVFDWLLNQVKNGNLERTNPKPGEVWFFRQVDYIGKNGYEGTIYNLVRGR